MHYILLLLAFAFHVMPQLNAQASDDSYEDVMLAEDFKPITLRDHARIINKTSIPPVYRSWSSYSQFEFLRKCIRTQFEQLPENKQKTAFELISSTSHATTSIVGEPTTWQDLALFAGKKPGDRYVGHILNRTKTALGKAQLLGLLAASSDDIAQITRRQEITKTLLANPTLLDELTAQLEDCTEKENFLFTFWQQDQFAQNINDYKINDPIFKFQDKPASALMFSSKYAFDLFQNSNRIISHVDNLQALISCLCLVLFDAEAPKTQKLLARAKNHQYKNLVYQFIWDNGPIATKWVLTALSAYLVYTAIDKTIDRQIDAWFFEEILHLKLTHIASIFSTMHKTAQLLTQENTLLTLLPELRELPKLFAITSEENGLVREFLDLIADDAFAQDANGFVVSRGKILRAYSQFEALKTSFVPALQALSLLDAYAGIATLMRFESATYCFAEFEKSAQPHIYLEDFTNPLVVIKEQSEASAQPDETRSANIEELLEAQLQKPDSKVVVTNTVELGQAGPSRNCVITGPNAGGKSTLIKAIGINVLMAQSLGIAAAKRCILTPFSVVATYLNITDDINAGNSLFKAEVLRTQELINKIDTLQPGQHGLLIFDEIFNGTTPTEGSAAAYAVAEHLGAHPNAITILATHFADLTKLETHPECSYKNYKVSVTINEDGSLMYPFKLQPGISQQHIALDILRSEGYSGSILTRTAHLLNR